MKKITKRDLTTLEQRRKKLAEIEEKINNRVEEIIYLIYQTFGCNIPDYWYYPNAEADQNPVGQIMFEPLIGEEQIGYVTDQTENEALVLAGLTWDYAEGFPKRFLLMDDAQIESEISNDIRALEEKEEAKERARKKVGRTRKDLVKAALEKLTKEEREALGYH